MTSLMTLIVPISMGLEEAGLNPTTLEQRREMLLTEGLGITLRADLTRLVAHFNTLRVDLKQAEELLGAVAVALEGTNAGDTIRTFLEREKTKGGQF